MVILYVNGMRTYMHIAGSTSSCHPSSPSSPVHVVANVPQVNTCDAATANITGGTKPYTVSIMPSNGDIPTNFTLGAEDDLFTYVNRVQPGSSFLSEPLPHS